MRELSELGLQEALAAHAIETRELAFYSRHGQFIYKEPRGRFAGYDWPQLSIHRADLHKVMLDTVRARLGSDAVRLAHRCLTVDQDGAGVVIHFDTMEPQRGKVAVGCDGIHSALRRQLVPSEGPPKYSGVNMWRGAVRWPAYLGGDTMVSTGWMTVGKTVIYPVRPGTPETAGLPLINWVAEIERPEAVRQDWTGRGRLGDIMPAFAGLKFDWLDISGMIESTEEILEYPMVDRDPLPRWSFGRITLLGDAAHPMYPRGSNGAGQAILDARFLTGQIKKFGATEAALQQYEAVRNPATAKVVLTNRTDPPDAILREVWQRSGGQRFERIEDVISRTELEAISERYKKVAGFDRDSLKARPSFV
jgi:2-polyprenyl-6-methoxyphenol hydroxylase-like FAD-dependent oxidoreductase